MVPCPPGRAARRLTPSPVRVFFFNRYVPPDHSATSQLLADLAGHLAAQGMAVTLVGSRQRYDDAGALLPERERIDGFDVLRVGGSRFGRDALAGRALDYLDYLRGARRVLKERARPGDLVVVMTDPPLLGTSLGALVERRGARCVHWLQDLFPEVAEGVYGRGARLLAMPLRWRRDRGLRRAAMVVTISGSMAALVAAAGVPRERIATIENWTDDEAIQPLAAGANPLRRDWGLEGKFVVGYSGNLGRAHDWRTLLEVATELRERDDIRFLLVGGGRGQQAFVAAARARGLDNVLLKPYQPRERLAHSLTLPDLHWLSLHPALEGCIFPSKWYGILASGRPALFVGDTRGELSMALSEIGSGLAVSPGDIDSTRTFIEKLASDASSATEMGRLARAYLETRNTRQAALKRWESLLRPADLT